MTWTKGARIARGALAAASLAAAGLPSVPARAEPAVFEVGAASRDISPNPTVAPPDGQVWLGGFGFGRADRRSTGVAFPIKVRAMVVSNGTETVALGINETQGMFAAYESGPYGLDDMRASIEVQTGIAADHVILGSNHSHRGPDTTGVWGGVPDSYLKFIRDQMVGAVADAYESREPATILAASIDAPETYGGFTIDAPEQDVIDSVVRVLQARSVAEPDRTIVTFVEAPYHSTNYGGDPTIHPDWPGVLSERLADTYGGEGFGWEGDIGRQYGAGDGPIFDAVQRAMAAAEPLADPTVDGRVRFFTEPITNPVYTYFLVAAYHGSTATCAVDPGTPYTLCTPVGRSTRPPYATAASIGTYASVLRIGEVLVAGGPGEVYPNVQKGLVERVGARHHFFLGLAQDQLGYLIAPATSWPFVVPQGGDNGLFNASPTIGDHLMCTQLALAAEVGFALSDAGPSYCPALTATDG